MSDRDAVYVFEGFRLDARRRVLFGPDGEPIPLTSRLFDTLLYLVERPGELVTKEKLLEAIWPHAVVEEQSLGKAISALRKALGEKPDEHRFIVTKHGLGYRFVARVSIVADAASDDDAVEIDGGGASPKEETAARVVNGAAPRPVRHRYAIGALIVLVAAIGAMLLGVGERSPDPSFRVRPWSAEKGGQHSAVWSPDSRSTALIARSSVDAPVHLNVRALDEPVARTIVRFAPAPTGPTDRGLLPATTQWTTDGKILYWYPPGLWSVSPVAAEPVLVAEMELDGQGPRQDRYARISGDNMHASPDGTAVATLGQAADGAVGVWTATLPEASFEPYEPAPFATYSLRNDPFLRFSPDGKQLLLLWTAGARGDEAWLLPFPPNPADPPRRVLERLPLVGDSEFSWWPDSRHVLVSAGSPQALYLADIATGAFRLLTSGPSDLRFPAVSPDADKLIYADHRIDYDIVMVDLRTAAVTPLIATEQMEMMPAWGAHTNALVYVTNRSGEWEIWVHEPPGPDRPVVTTSDFKTNAEGFAAPTLSPDGARVIYQRGEAGGYLGLWMSSVAGGPPERVTTGVTAEFPGSWSPDGAWYAYMGNEQGSRVLKKVRTTGRATPTTLAPVAEGGWLPIWSPDGDWILLPNDGVLLSTDGATRRDLKLGRAQCAFAKPPEPLLYCIQPVPEEERLPLLVAADFEGNVVRTVGSLRREHLPATHFGPGLRLSVTPDGNGLTYSVFRFSQTMLLMDGLAAIDLP